MKLHFSATSPFVRKVMIAAHEKGLAKRIEAVEEQNVGATNPLSKVPALVTDDGEALYDSLVICDYLDNLDGSPTLIPSEAKGRTAVLRLHALADGIMEAGVACVTESRRPKDKQWSEFSARQKGKIEAAIDELDKQCAEFGTDVNLATISIGAALGYVDFRLGDDIDWRKNHTKLAAWYADFAQRHSMKATTPPT